MAKKGKGQNASFRRELMFGGSAPKPANDPHARIVHRVTTDQFLRQLSAGVEMERQLTAEAQRHAAELRARGFTVTIER